MNGQVPTPPDRNGARRAVDSVHRRHAYIQSQAHPAVALRQSPRADVPRVRMGDRRRRVDGWHGRAGADWLKDPPSFPIRYVRQEHAHKKAAINRAARLARGELFVVADSDDELVPQALEVLHRAWQSVPNGERRLYAGVLCLCRDADGHVVRETFPEWALAGVPADAFLTTLRVKGEKWGCTRTELWRRYPYPENIPGFVPEGTGAHQRFKGLQVLCLNEALRIYHQDAD